MLRALLGDIELEYEVRGAGEPVMLIHAGGFAQWYAGLAREPALSSGYRLIRYHRIGYAGSGRLRGPVSIGDQAAHCRSLMRQLGVARAHVVGHSSGANIALQLALDYPDAVRSIALLETALQVVPGGPFAARAIGHYRAGDPASAVDVWMRGVAGPDYRGTLDRVLPGAFDHAVADADTFFGQELPAVGGWSFGPAEAKRIEQPALVVLGGRSHEVTPAYGQRTALLLDWLPDATRYVLPDATHLMHVQNPIDMAKRLAGFFGLHLIPPPKASEPPA